MIFDSHAHLLADDDARYPIAPLSGTLRPGDLDERYTAERLLGLMDASGVERAVAVQRAHVYGYDNSYVCDAAERYPDRLVAVAAVDARAPDVARQIGHWIGERGAVGVRFAALGPAVANTDWCASPAAEAAWAAVAEQRASICIHVFRPIRTRVLADIAPLMRRYPTVPVVIDHVSNAALGEDGALGWDEALSRFAALPNAYLKLTTINLRRIAEAGADARAVLAGMLAHVAAERLLWGSDIAQTKGDYGGMVDLLRDAVSTLPPADRAAVTGAACRSVYGTAAASAA